MKILQISIDLSYLKKNYKINFKTKNIIFICHKSNLVFIKNSKIVEVKNIF